MADDLLQRKIRVMFKAGAATSRIARDLSEDGFSPEEIENAIEEFAQARQGELKTKRLGARVAYALMFLLGLLMNIYWLFIISETHYVIWMGFTGLMTWGAVGFFLTVKPRSPRRR